MASDGGSVAVLVNDADDLRPVERTRLLAVNWELLPRVARCCSRSCLTNLTEDVVVASAFLGKKFETGLVGCGFVRGEECGSACVWRRVCTSHGVENSLSAAMPWWREMLGVGLVCGLLICIFLWIMRWEGNWDTRRTLLLCLSFVVLSGITLTCGLLAPNGLGVYGGKAKLFFCTGGIPDGFWTNPEYAVYQPSYPPGLVAFALLVDMLSGGCGDWLVQLLGPCALALLVAAIVGRRPSWIMVLATLSFAFSPWSVWLASEFYAEPFAALCLVCGWRKAWACGGRWAWLVVGCAGLFRHEGIAAAVLLWGMTRWFGIPTRARWGDLACVVSLPLAWQVFRFGVAAELPDFVFSRFLDVGTVVVMAKHAIVLITRFWEAGGIVFLLLFAVVCGRKRTACIAGGASVVFLVVACCALAFNRTPHVAWLASNCIPRLILIMFAVTLGSVTITSGRSPHQSRRLCF